MIDHLLDGVVRGVFNTRGKRSKKALKYLTGKKGGFLSNPQTLLMAAGLAWGVYETMQQSPQSFPQGGPQPMPPTPAAPPAAVNPPPLPNLGPAAPAVSQDVLRLVRLVISAANADGTIGERERAEIARHAEAVGASDLVATELSQPRPLAEIVAGVADPAERATLYVLAYTVLRADEQVTGAERIYLAQLANLLGLDPARVQELEQNASERITQADDES